MTRNGSTSPGLPSLLGRLGHAALKGVHTRIELLAVEWQQERLRLADLLLWSATLVFLAMMGTLLLTATIIFLFPADKRIYVTAVLAVLYLLGAAAAGFAVRAVWKHEAFVESIDQVKKDRQWLESLE